MAEADPSAALTPADSGYWVLRFATARERPALAAVLHWEAELGRIVLRCTDPGATRLKLDWWRGVLADPTASLHPLAPPLAPFAADTRGLTALRTLLDAAETQVCKQQPVDQADFHRQCERGSALAHLLTLAVDAAPDETTLAQADALGRYADAVRRVQLLGQFLRKDHNPLPRDLLPRGNAARWDDAALAAACEDLLAPLGAAAETLLGDRGRTLAPARRWTVQARSAHRLLQREGYALRRQYLDITPLARLWAAWRVR